MHHPFLAIRLWPQHHERPELLPELLAEVRRHPGCCDEVWFSTAFGFPRMAEHRRSAERMAAAAAKVRAAGIIPSFQVAATLGHADMAILPADGLRWQRLVGPDGRMSAMCNCPRAPEFLGYLGEMTRLYAAWGPYRVMIDDDLRVDHHTPLLWPCFCPRCLADFGAGQGRRWSRESLVRALNRPGTDGALRLAWTRFNAQSLAGVARAVAAGVRAVSPASRMGLQHAGHELTIYSGPDWRPVLQTLARVSRHPVSSRPGHGFYHDQRPRDMIDKAFLIADQNARLPAGVDAVCAEIENFTHHAMGKTAHGMAVESALDLAVGCNSLSYAILCSGHESTAWYGRTLLRTLAAWRPFWLQLAAAGRGTRCGGIGVTVSQRQAGRRLRRSEPPWAWAQLNLGAIHQLAAIGVPVMRDPAAGCCQALHAGVVPALSDAELRRLLAGGVLLDGDAAWEVQARGLGRLLGVEVLRFEHLDSHERLTADRLNGVHAGQEWWEFFTRAGAPIYRLVPRSRGVRVLGEYVNAHGVVTGAATIVFPNARGGRVAILGCNGWQTSISSAKRRQLLAAVDWISRGRMPAWVETPAQAMVVPRVDARGRLRNLTVLNTCLDTTPSLTVRLRGVRARRALWVQPAGRARQIVLRPDGAERIARLPPIAPWQIGHLQLLRGRANGAHGTPR